MLKWTLRIGGGLLALVLLTLTVLFLAYSMWISGLTDTLTKGSQIAHMPLGDIEYAVIGEGEPRLVIHGMPGGYDQGLLLHRAFPEHFDGMQTIAISRPGYLRTPVASGETPEEQADLYAALLDELKIERIVVEGASGGAPSAVQFALRHPERTKSLILLAPLFEGWEGKGNELAPPDSFLLQENIIAWLAGDRLARRMLPQADFNDEKQMQAVRALVKTSLPTELRVDGMVNDARAFNKLDYAAWPLEQIAVPTLILQGDADMNVSPEATVAAAARIPGAELHIFVGAGHFFMITHTNEMFERMRKFASGLTN
jgi:pimeloyl-ACP methyl ester carboxylesterase